MQSNLLTQEGSTEEAQKSLAVSEAFMPDQPHGTFIPLFQPPCPRKFNGARLSSLLVVGVMRINTNCWYDALQAGFKLTTADAGGEVAMTSGLGPLTLQRHNYLMTVISNH